MPSPLDCIGRRRFAFYPPIRNIDANEWVLGNGSWTEVQVVNARTGGEIWISRQYVGAVSESNDSLLIVGLAKELAYRNGIVEPRIKRVIEMPHVTDPVIESPETERPSHGPAEVIGIRIENREDSPMNRALLTFGIGALIVSLIAILISVLTRR